LHSVFFLHSLSSFRTPCNCVLFTLFALLPHF
jgi:hypothetical protein